MPANPDFDDIVTTTLRNRTGKLADNATRTTAGLDRARRKGKIKRLDGGRTIVKELEVALNPNGGWFAGYDLLNVTPFQPFTAAEYDWKQAYEPCAWNGREKRMNMGREQSIQLIGGRVKNSEKSLYDLVAQAYYSDGTSFSGKQLHGLNLLVPVDPTTGTVGGIDRSLNSFWQSQLASVDFDAAINIAATAPSAFLSAMNSLAIATTRGTDRPDLWLFDAIGYTRYLESLQPLQQIQNTEMTGAGFSNLKYFGVGQSSDVVLDNGYCPSKTGFAANTEYIYLDVHSDLDFEPMGGERMPINQDATVRFFGFMGNLCGSNLKLQGRMKDAGT
jgi:hypothetical protein